MNRKKRSTIASKPKKQEEPSSQINAKWFKDQMMRVGTNSKEIAKILGINPTVVSHMLNGRRSLKLKEAVAFAKILKAPLTDVLANAGIAEIDESMLPTSGSNDLSPVKGWVNPKLEIVWEAPKDQKKVPNPLPGEKLICVRCQTSSGPFDGIDGALVYFHEVEKGTFDPEAMGRLCVIEAQGKSFLRILKRGYSSGKYNLAFFGGQAAEEGVTVTTATPVVWMRL